MRASSLSVIRFEPQVVVGLHNDVVPATAPPSPPPQHAVAHVQLPGRAVQQQPAAGRAAHHDRNEERLHGGQPARHRANTVAAADHRGRGRHQPPAAGVQQRGRHRGRRYGRSRVLLPQRWRQAPGHHAGRPNHPEPVLAGIPRAGQQPDRLEGSAS